MVTEPSRFQKFDFYVMGHPPGDRAWVNQEIASGRYFWRSTATRAAMLLITPVALLILGSSLWLPLMAFVGAFIAIQLTLRKRMERRARDLYGDPFDSASNHQ